jgi:hypothetical protein
MQDFIRNLQDINWWLGIVIVGLIINLSSSYLKPKLDNALGKISTKRKLLNENTKRKIDEKVAFLLNDHTHLQVMRLENFVTQLLIRFFACVIITLLMMIAIIFGPKAIPFSPLSIIILFGIIVIMLIMTLYARISAFQIETLLNEYYKQQTNHEMNPL